MILSEKQSPSPIYPSIISYVMIPFQLQPLSAVVVVVALYQWTSTVIEQNTNDDDEVNDQHHDIVYCV